MKTMEKKLEDYLHLYIGSQIKIVKSNYWLVHERSIHSGDVRTLNVSLLYDAKLHSADIQLILRPISDMSEEEAREFCKLEGWGENIENIIVTDSAIEFNTLTQQLRSSCISRFNRCRPEMFLWLTKRGFDLFGLIPASLALDATTLKK